MILENQYNSFQKRHREPLLSRAKFMIKVLSRIRICL